MERGPAPPLQIGVSWDGVVATATVTGELERTRRGYRAGLAGRLMSVAKARPGRLVLDLGRLVFVDGKLIRPGLLLIAIR